VTETGRQWLALASTSRYQSRVRQVLGFSLSSAGL